MVLTVLLLVGDLFRRVLLDINSSLTSYMTTLPLLFSLVRAAHEMLKVVSFTLVGETLSGATLGSNKEKCK